MKRLVLLFFLVMCFTGCATMQQADFPRSAYASDSPMPQWIGLTYWTDENFMYAVGGVHMKDTDDLGTFMRISEVNAVTHMLRANGLCGGKIIGKLPIESWVSPGGGVFTLVRAEKITQRDECLP